MNNFQKDLEYSTKSEITEIFDKIYQQAFPRLLVISRTNEYGELQEKGIDVTIILSSGKAIYIDEKVRRTHYNDILLEYISNDHKMTPGWVEKPLFCDYIAYIILKANKCFLLPIPQLQKIWLENKNQWLNIYGTIKAKNIGYNTLSCAIPVKIIFSALGKSLRISF